MDKAMRARIDELVDLYLNHIESPSSDAGWHQPSQMEMLATSRVQTSGDQADMKMIREVRYLRGEHALLPMARHLIGRTQPCGQCGKAERVLGEDGRERLEVPAVCPRCEDRRFVLAHGRVPERHAVVLLASRYYKQQTADVVADYLRLSTKAYEGRLARAREIIALELLDLERYEALRGAGGYV